MSLIRKFNRARTRDARRREAQLRPRTALTLASGRSASTSAGEPRDIAFATVAGPFGVLRDFLGLGECACPVCEYLAAHEIPSETLEDGTVVHRLTSSEHEEIEALMASMNPFGALGGGGADGSDGPITH